MDELQWAGQRDPVEQARLWMETLRCKATLRALMETDPEEAEHQRRLAATLAYVAGRLPRPDAVIISHGDGCYSIGSYQPIKLTCREDDLLEAILQAGGTMNKQQLVAVAGVEGTTRLKAIATKYGGRFAPAIFRPGRKGAGGYRVAIRRAQEKSDE